MKYEIEKQINLLNCNSVAVRSSAKAEDLPGKSFAGQYETFLGIKDSNKCLNAIKS
jgi:phosphoenolpyruvate synthase/pyruvate phosphate dikinase